MSKQYPGGIISKTAPVPSGPYANSTAPGVWTLNQQAYWQKLGQWPTQGNTQNFIENVFSTYLYTGNGSTQTITNGIDLSGKGGLTWIKRRDAVRNHQLFDTARGATKILYSDLTNAQDTDATSLTSFNSDGFSLGLDGGGNANGGTYASWTFRKQPKFFDVVTYTGTGSNRTIAHNLGSTPGCIIIKCTSSAYVWAVYHRGMTSAAFAMQLQATDAQSSEPTYFNSTAPTSTVFSVGTSNTTNQSGQTYVAYLFAHDAGGFGLTGTDNAIMCGSYVRSNGKVTLGFEPQWIMIKSASGVSSWRIVDNMRGLTASGTDAYLFANLTNAEASGSNILSIDSTGFTDLSSASTETIIYIAIRRGPMAVPTSGTSVFNPYAYTANGTTGRILTGASAPNADLVLQFNRAAGCGVVDRLRGFKSELGTYDTGAESPATYGITAINSTSIIQNDIGGFYVAWNFGSQTYVSETFARAPSFLDVVCYTGNASARTINHNLAAVPELMIVKSRSAAGYWPVYSAAIGTDYILSLDTTAAKDGPGAPQWNSTTPTSSVFSLGNSTGANANGVTFVAYLFATCAGVSKVGSYTGTATTLQINCGFTAGARFVLIKRTDSTGDWYVWDSARGIVAGNDPYKILNSSTAEVTNTDYVDAYSAGFEISSTAPAAINASGGTFIFLAIA